MLPVAVLAGGLGTRIRELTEGHIPKALVLVKGRPFVDYKLEGLVRSGVSDVILLVGELGDQIRDHVGDGKRYRLRVTYLEDGPRLLGTGGAVRAALPLLPEAFWVTYCDTFLQLDMAAAERTFRVSRWLGLMTILRNKDRWQPSNVLVENGVVTSYRSDPPPGTHAFIDYGILMLRRQAFDAFAASTSFDLGAVFRHLVERRQLGAFEVAEPFHTIGTPDEVRETEAFFARNDL